MTWTAHPVADNKDWWHAAHLETVVCGHAVAIFVDRTGVADECQITVYAYRPKPRKHPLDPAEWAFFPGEIVLGPEFCPGDAVATRLAAIKGNVVALLVEHIL